MAAPNPTTIDPHTRGPGTTYTKKAAQRRLFQQNETFVQNASALGELLAPACFMQADLLALDFPRITGDEPGLRQHGLKGFIVCNQRAGNPVPNSTGLPRFAAASDIHQNIEGIGVLRQLERLSNDHPSGFPGEKVVKGLAIHDDRALPWLQKHSRDSRLAAASSVILSSHIDDPSDLQRLGLLGCMGMFSPGVALELLEHSVTEGAFRQHALHRDL
jgi:hypothetical protein